MEIRNNITVLNKSVMNICITIYIDLKYVKLYCNVNVINIETIWLFNVGIEIFPWKLELI